MEYELNMLLDPWSKLIDKLIVAHIVTFLAFSPYILLPHTPPSSSPMILLS